MTVKRVKNQFIQLVVGVSVSMSAVVMASAAIQPPEMDNTAYVLMDYNTGEILAQKNANQSLPPASLTKMMTSYIIEQRLASGDLKEDEQVLMSQNAWCRGSSSQSCMYVPVNKTASVIDMLRGIIIQSGNDASQAMAEHIAGSESSFAVLMNEQAEKLGMTNSNFVNSTGMPADNHKASALDLAKLSRAIIKNSGDYYNIYSEKEFTYNGITQGNRNALLATDPTVDGLKTGHTDAAGYCLAASSKREDMRLISVIMGAGSMQARADQSRELLNWGFGHFTTVTKAPAGQFVSKVPVWFGQAQEIELATGDNLQILTSKTQKNKITTVVDIPDSLEAPIKKGQEVGKMMAVIDGKAVASVPVIATSDIEESGFMSRTWQRMVRWVQNLM